MGHWEVVASFDLIATYIYIFLIKIKEAVFQFEKYCHVHCSPCQELFELAIGCSKHMGTYLNTESQVQKQNNSHSHIC